MSAVEESFNLTDPQTLEHNVLSLMTHMEASLAVNGGNNYKIPRLNKQKTKGKGNQIRN